MKEQFHTTDRKILDLWRPGEMVRVREMERRRNAAVKLLSMAVDQLGPITDQTRMSIREAILDIVDQIYAAGEDLKKTRFDVYTRRNKARPRF